ncbi:nascent polypeptide-associated complex subunit alpha, muscle-specific form-like [Choloepus didactylus]|uniref:nascent polypeptide-associated complex subunit alpha, muscle-specific form-like n=1 Tax=Choloepus didactylus TaxID=27675 RepID=UPI00189E4038|nr:nascent polypeptide-associated complex subunit alpha, muscle-specific form-like [Choloepus didactylus]
MAQGYKALLFLIQLGLHNSSLFFLSLSFFIPFFCFAPAILPTPSALSVTAALEQPGPTLPPPCSLVPQQGPLATANQPSPFPTPSTPFEVPFPHSSLETALALGGSPSPAGTPTFLPDLIGPPISPAALALASPMIAPALKGAHSSSAPLALVALAPPSVQKSSAFPPNPLTSPPPVVATESGLMTSLSTPVAPSDPKTSIQVPSQVVTNPKGTPSPPGIVSDVSPHFVTPLAPVQSVVTPCPQTPPAAPLTITSSQVKGIPVPSALISPQNPVNITLKGSLSPPAALPLSTQCVPTTTSSQKTAAPSVPPVFLTSLGSHLVPLHESSFSSPVQPSGQTGPYVLSDPTVDTVPVGHSQRSVIPPLPSRNEVVPAVVGAFPVTSPLVLTSPSTITSDSTSGSPNVATSFPLSLTASLIPRDSPDSAHDQSLVSQVPASPGSPGLKEAPVSFVGATPLVITSPSAISAAPPICEVATCISSPVSSASHTTLVIAPVVPKELPTPQELTTLGTAVSPPPLPVPEDSRSLPTSVLVKLPTQKDLQTVPACPVRDPISPDQPGLSTKKDPTLPPLALAAPKDSPSPQSLPSLEMSLSPKAALAKESPVKFLPVVELANTITSSPGVLNSPASVIKTDSYTSPGPASVLLKSFPTTPTVATFSLESGASAAPTDIPNKKDPAAPAGVAPATATATAIPITTAIPFLEGAVSSEAPKSQPAKKGASTLPLLPSASVTCPVAPAVISSPQVVSTSVATLALAPEITKSVPLPSLPPTGMPPPNAEEVDDISHTAALAPAASSTHGHPAEKGSGASVTASSKGTQTYLADSPSPSGTSVSPQTKRPPAKKGSAPSPTTLTLAPSVSKSVPAIPDSPVGNLPLPISPVEVPFLPEASLSFQGPKGSPAKKHSPTPPSCKGASAFPSPKDAPTTPVLVPSPKETLLTPSPKRAPTPQAITLPSSKGDPNPSAEILPSPKGTSAISSPKGDPTTPAVTPPFKGDPNPPAETPLPTPTTKKAPTTLLVTPLSSKGDSIPPVEILPPTKGVPKTSSTKGSPSAPPEIPFSKRDPSPPAETPPPTKGTPATLATKKSPATPSVTPLSSKGDLRPPAEALSPTKGVPPTPPTKWAPATHPVTPLSSKEGPNPPAETPPSTKGASDTPCPKRTPATPPTKGTSSKPRNKGVSKGDPNPPAETPPSTKGAPATPPTKGPPPSLSPKRTPVIPPAREQEALAAPNITPLSYKGDLNLPAETPPSTKGSPPTLPTKGTPAIPAMTPPSSKEDPSPPAAIPPSLKGVPATPSPIEAPTVLAITPPSSKGTPIPLAETPLSPQKASAAPSPKGTPAIPAVAPSSPKGAPPSPVSVNCPLETIAPQSSKGEPFTKKGPATFQEVPVAPGPVIPAATQKGPPAKKGSAASPPTCPDSSAKNGNKGPLSSVPPAPPKTPKVLPVSAVKDKDSVHSPKGSLEAPESKTSIPLATAASEKVLPKAGSASVSPGPTPAVSLPLAPSPVPPLLPKQQLPPSSPGLVLESPHKPPAPADEDELPPLIPPEPVSGGVPFQSVLVNMPIPKPAGIPAPTPSTKQPVLKNNKGICLGLLCAWCVAHTPLGVYPPILTLGCAAFSDVSACVWT